MALVENGKDFLKSVGWVMDSQNRLITGGVEDKRRHNRVMEKWDQIKKVGYELVTVVNCMPFPLQINGMVGFMEVRACNIDKGELFFPFEIDRPRMPVTDEGEAKFTPEPVLPVEFAMEFDEKYREFGGVFFYRRKRDGSDIDKSELMTMVDAAHKRMEEYMTAQYNLGEDNWQRYNKQPRRISPHSRTAAHFLRTRGIIETLPEWVNIKKSTSGTKPCEHCAEQIKAEAKICRFCTLRQDVSLDEQTQPGRTIKARPENEPEPQAGGVSLPLPTDEVDGEGEDNDLELLNQDEGGDVAEDADSPRDPAAPRKKDKKKGKGK